MELIQFLTRNSDGTATWSKRFSMVAGYSENFVLDKTTDFANDIMFDVYGSTEPQFEIMQWCRILSVQNVDDPATYDANGLPLNNRQYVVSGYKSDWIGTAAKHNISMTLAEPIERMRGVVGETLSYTNQTVKVQDGIAYYRDAYNHYNALRRWLEITPANNKPSDAWLTRIRILDQVWLQGIPFADTTLNELSLYDLLMDIYDSSTGRTPVIYFDMNTTTDMPNNQARDEYILKFERQDGYDKKTVNYQQLIKGAKQVTKTKDLANYATGLVVNAENISSSTGINYPAQGLYAVPEVDADVRDTTSYNTPGTDNWIIRYPHDTKRVSKLIRTYYESYRYDVATDSALTTISSEDRTDYVYERKQYLSADPNGDPTSNRNYYWFEEGNNKLHLKEYYYLPLNNPERFGTYMYYMEYEPLINGRLIVGDENYVQQINQSAPQIDSDKFADYLNQYHDGMNKADITITKTHIGTSKLNAFNIFSSRFGCRVIGDGDKEYIITAISYRNRQDQYDVVYQLNENHFRKNNSYQAGQSIRTNVDIPYNNLQERKTAIRQVINIGLNPQTQPNRILNYKNKAVFLSALASNQFGGEFYPQIALVKTLSWLKNAEGSLGTYSKTLTTNVAQFAFGNQVIFNVRFFDNAEAGKQKTITPRKRTSSNPPADVYYYGTEPDKQIPLLYTDPFGEVGSISVYLSNLTNGFLPDMDKVSGNATLREIFAVYETMANLPAIDEDRANELIENSVVSIADQTILKDSLEILNDNIIVDLQSDDIIICDAFTKYCRVVNQSFSSTAITVRFFDAFKDKNDSLMEGIISSAAYTGAMVYSDRIRVTFNVAILTERVKSAVIFLTEGGINHKFLIINFHDDTMREKFADGFVDIYFA